MRKGMVLAVILMAGIFTIAKRSKSDTPKVPDEIQIRILKIRNDQIQMESQRAAIQAQYEQAYQKAVASQLAAISHDDLELRDIRTEALKAANLDAAKYDLDVAKLEFVAKPAVQTPDAKK
jgi:hypothetical protein